jgi:hypothetical protein
LALTRKLKHLAAIIVIKKRFDAFLPSLCSKSKCSYDVRAKKVN